MNTIPYARARADFAGTKGRQPSGSHPNHTSALDDYKKLFEENHGREFADDGELWDWIRHEFPNVEKYANLLQRATVHEAWLLLLDDVDEATDPEAIDLLLDLFVLAETLSPGATRTVDEQRYWELIAQSEAEFEGEPAQNTSVKKRTGKPSPEPLKKKPHLRVVGDY